MAGDFNSKPDLSVYNFITGQQPNFNTSDKYYTEEKAALITELWETSGVKLKSGYENYENGQHPKLTHHKVEVEFNFKATIDYIFHSSGITPLELLPIPSDEELYCETTFPN